MREWLVGFLAVLLVGCSSASGTSSATAESQPTNSVTAGSGGSARSLFADPDAETEPSDLPEEGESGAVADVGPIDASVGMIVDPERLSLIFGEAYRHHAESTQECLSAQGFGGYRVEMWTVPTPEEFRIVDGNQGLEKYGYGLSVSLRAQFENLDRDSGGEDAGVNEAFIASLGEEELQAFHITRTQCEQEAWRLYPVPGSYPEAVAEEIVEMQLAALQSHDVVEGWASWSSCMSSQGYDYTDRIDVVGGLESTGSGLTQLLEVIGMSGLAGSHPDAPRFVEELGEFEALESSIVQADLACVEQSGIDDLKHDALRSAELAWVEANEDRLALLRSEAEGQWYDSVGKDLG